MACYLSAAPKGPREFGSGSLLIFGLYSFIICLVAALLYVAVNNLEPNRREATALKILIIGLAGAAIRAIHTRAHR